MVEQPLDPARKLPVRPRDERLQVVHPNVPIPMNQTEDFVISRRELKRTEALLRAPVLRKSALGLGIHKFFSSSAVRIADNPSSSWLGP
jgi:hypothetical protein